MKIYIKKVLLGVLFIVLAFVVFCCVNIRDHVENYEQRAEQELQQVPDDIKQAKDCTTFAHWKHKNKMRYASCPWEKPAVIFKVGKSELSVPEIFAKDSMVRFEYPAMLPVKNDSIDNIVSIRFSDERPLLELQKVKPLGFDQSFNKQRYQVMGEEGVAYIYTNDDLENINQFTFCEGGKCRFVLMHNDIYVYINYDEKFAAMDIESHLSSIIRFWQLTENKR